MTKPVVQLTRINGNVFVIIGACTKAARRAGWTKEQVDELRDKMMHADSYDHVLQIAMTELEVE